MQKRKMRKGVKVLLIVLGSIVGLCLLVAISGLLFLSLWPSVGKMPGKKEQEAYAKKSELNDGKSLKLRIGETEVSVEWEDNESVKALQALVADKPLTISMSMYGGFEQVGSLGTVLPRQDKEITTEAGDIVLYSGNQIVVFYGSNLWAYTRLGKITDRTASEMKDLLGNGNVSITISTE